jgi:hypothetical protein
MRAKSFTTHLLAGAFPSAIVLASAISVGDALGATYVVPPDAMLVDKANTIVLATCTLSTAREPRTHGVETVVTFAVQEVLKGDAALTSLRVRVPGGAAARPDGTIVSKVVPGAPQFRKGERALLFLHRVNDGEFAVLDLALGAFRFVEGPGHQFVLSRQPDVTGWGIDGAPHVEAARDPAAFMRFIRSRVRGERVAVEYVVSTSAK